MDTDNSRCPPLASYYEIFALMRQTDSSSNHLLSFATSWLPCARWIAETNPKDVSDIPFISGIPSPSRTFLQLHHLIISPPFSIIPLMQRVTRETRDSRETRGVVCLPALFASRSGISARKPPRSPAKVKNPKQPVAVFGLVRLRRVPPSRWREAEPAPPSGRTEH